MNAFFNALYSLFTSTDGGGLHNDFYNAVGGRFSYGVALQQSAMPYAVFFGVSSVPADTFTEELDDMAFQVNIYGDGNYQEIGSALRFCRNLFDGAVLAVDGYDVLIRREMEVPPWRDGDLWVASVEFNTMIQGA